MYNQPFLTDENKMVADMYRSFVDKEIMPIRQQVDDDKEHILIKQVLQKLTDVGHQKAPFPPEYGGQGMTSVVSAAILHEELGRGDSGIGTAATVTTWAWPSVWPPAAWNPVTHPSDPRWWRRTFRTT